MSFKIKTPTQETNKFNFDRLSWFFWLIPITVILISHAFLGKDTFVFIKWYLTFFILSLIFLPVTTLIFKKSKDRGYAFSKPLSMAISGFIIWTLSYIKILPFRAISIIILLIVLFIIFMLLKKPREAFKNALENPSTIRLMAFEEGIFAAGLLFWSFVRGIKPVLDSLEKPMDYGFMMSLMRTDFLPAKDMWYSLGDINYYYFGQYIYTFMTKLSGLTPQVTYNLSMGATFALTISLSFALGYMFIEMGMKKGLRLFNGTPMVGGIISSVLVTFAGNSHSFFYGTHNNSAVQKIVKAPGHFLLKFFNDKGLLEKWTPVATDMIENSDTNHISIDSFWFANSTRYIGHNPSTHDKTIHEFPFYSFLVADLHAHLINLCFVMLLIGLLVVIYNSDVIKKIANSYHKIDISLDKTNDKNWFKIEFKNILLSLKNMIINPIFLLISLLLGIFMMCNFWDFAIYIVVISMTLLIVNLNGCGKLASWETVPIFILQLILVMIPFLFISNPALAVLGYAVVAFIAFGLLMLSTDAFTITGAQISLLFLLSHFLILPFNWNFEPISKSIALVVDHTPIFQLTILWGTHILVCLLFLIYVIRKRVSKKDAPYYKASFGKGPISSFFLGISPMDLFMAGLFVCGLIFVLLPEIIYVVDIYSGDYKRANTMFKFTYQAFLMLSLVMGYAVTRLVLTKPGKSKIDYRWSLVSVFMALLLIIPMYYPSLSTAQWIGKLERDRYVGLDGVSGLPNPDIVEGIEWINENIKGQPVLLEAYGDSYTEFCALSAYTGLRTVVGWQTHEWLWRTSKYVQSGYSEIVVPKQNDVKAIYEFADGKNAKRLIKDYEVEYIAVGQNERSKFPEIDEDSIKGLGPMVYSNSSLYIIKIAN